MQGGSKMNKKVVFQVGCFLVMFALEMIAAQFEPSSTAFNAFLILALLMIPAFVLAGHIPEASKNEANLQTAIPEAA